MYLCVLIWIYMHPMHEVFIETRRGHQIPGNWHLQMFVNYHVGDGNWSQVLCKSGKYSKALNHLFSPKITFFKENLRWYFVYWSSDFSRNNPGFRRIKGILTKLFVASLPAKLLVQFWYHTFMYFWVSPRTSVCVPVLVPENLLC